MGSVRASICLRLFHLERAATLCNVSAPAPTLATMRQSLLLHMRPSVLRICMSKQTFSVFVRASAVDARVRNVVARQMRRSM